MDTGPCIVDGLVAVGVDLEDAPLFVRDLEGVVPALVPVPAGYGEEVVENMLLGEDGELDVIGGDVEEVGPGEENLADNGGGEGGVAAPRYVQQGAGHWQERDRHLHQRWLPLRHTLC